MRRFLDLLAAAALTVAVAQGALAQSQSSVPAGGSSTTTAPATLQADEPPPATGGIQGQNIFEVKPEVKRDASSQPGYLQQNNAERNQVQPGNNAPLWRRAHSGVEGYSSLPQSEAPEAGVLMQGQVKYPGSRLTTAGQAWREVRNNWLIPYGGALLLIITLALAIFYFTKGPMGHHRMGPHPRAIERFTPFERANHWANAIAFVALAVSGIVMAFGKFFLLPVIGQTLFGYLTYFLKNLHNFAGPLFAVSLVLMIITFFRDNLPQKGDLRWLLRFGNMLGRQELPSHRFNAGEKVVFWAGVLFLGLLVVASGLFMDKLLPGFTYERQSMQIGHMIHAATAVLMLAMFIGHIYIGTIGMRGAYTAMRRGYVDAEWAREHHAYWYEDIQAGRVPAQRSKPLVIVDDTSTVRTV